MAGGEPQPREPELRAGDRLDSWKEIAAYLRREVRTVQLWEKDEALPVYRHGHRKRGTVYAFKPEIDAWWRSRRTVLEMQMQVRAREPRRWRWTLVAATAVALIVAGALWFRLLQKPRSPPSEFKLVPLTSYPGMETSPSFSPDGSQVAFEWCPEERGKNCQIYVKQIGVEPPSQLTDNPVPSYSPAWSPDGQTIAFQRQLSPAKTALILIPQRGGRERVLVELDVSKRKVPLLEPHLAWTPDSKWLVSSGVEATTSRWSLFMFSVETGEKRQLTRPPAVGVGGIVHDTAPDFSPDGRTLVFTRYGRKKDLYLLRLAEGYMPEGEPERIGSDNVLNLSAAWTPDGKEIVFSSGTWGSHGLWRVAASQSGKPRRLAFPGEQASKPVISRQGNRLAYAEWKGDTNIWRVDLGGAGQKPSDPVKFISSTRGEAFPSYSPDGKRIAFVSTRSGTEELWVCENDGAYPVQLTWFRGAYVSAPRWSPGGESISFHAVAGGNKDIYVISANGGTPRRLTTDPKEEQQPSWTKDGKWLYFHISPGGQVWKMPSSGGEAVQVTRNQGNQQQESPDGKWLYYCRGWPGPLSVWRMPVEGGQETKVLDSVDPDGQWTVGKEGIYFLTTPDEERYRSICLHKFTTGKTRKLATIERPVSWRIAVSPDGQTVLYTQVDEAASDLMLVENFR